jgi:hypothetical protein
MHVQIGPVVFEAEAKHVFPQSDTKIWLLDLVDKVTIDKYDVEMRL